MKHSILIAVETDENGYTKSTLETGALAKSIARGTDCEPRFVVVGHPPEQTAEKLADQSGLNVLVVESTGNTAIPNHSLGRILAALSEKFSAQYILLPHTPFGMDLAPGLAAGLEGAYIPAVEAVAETEHGPVFNRAVYGGKTLIRVLPESFPAVITVQPGAFKPIESEEKQGNLEVVQIDAPPARMSILGYSDTDQGGEDITKADVIAAAGRGIGSAENLDLVQRLAALFPKSAVAGSRPVCDNGWLEYGRQVGMTGRTVSPKLYISCGISGARQHTVGMQGSGFIVAISTDPGAAIFSTADVGIVEDLAEFIPIILEEYEKR